VSRSSGGYAPDRLPAELEHFLVTPTTVGQTAKLGPVLPARFTDLGDVAGRSVQLGRRRGDAVTAGPASPTATGTDDGHRREHGRAESGCRK